MKLLSPNQAAEILGVSVKTIYRMINRGKLTRIKIESATRISDKEVIAYLKKQGLKEVSI